MKPKSLIYIEVPAPETECHHERNKNHYSLFSKTVWRELFQRSGFRVDQELSYRFEVDAGKDEYWGFYCRKHCVPGRLEATP